MLLEKWNQFSSTALGRTVFNKLFGYYVPYSGSVYPEILELRPGFCRIQIKDRRKIRNHLNSIHAAALMNVAEAASGLAFICGLPKDARGIVTEFKVQYKKKARGTLTAECTCPVVQTSAEASHTVEALIKDESGDVVAMGQATWLIRPARS